MADIELEVLSRAIMLEAIDQLIVGDIEERHWFDPDARAVFKTCADHYSVWRKSLSLESVKRHHPDFRIVPTTDDLGYLIEEFKKDRLVKIATTKMLDMHRTIAVAEDAREPEHRQTRENLLDLLMEHMREVAALAPGEKVSRFSDMGQRVRAIRDQQRAGVLPGVPTGIPSVDPYVRVIKPGDFFVQCGFSSKGKTQGLVRSSVQTYAAGDVVLMNSLEMSPDEIWEIYDAEAAKLSRRAIQFRDLSEADYERYEQTAARVRAAQNDIVYVRVESVDKLAAMVERYGAQTVCVDYVSLMEGQLRARADWERVKEVSQSLKKLAGHMNVRVYAAAQSGRDAALNGPTEDNIAHCVPMQAQVLTRRGWMSHDEIEKGDETLGFDPSLGKSRWTEIEAVHRFDDAPLVRFGHSRWSQVCTPNHRWIGDQLIYRDGEFSHSVPMRFTPESVNGRSRVRLAAQADLYGSVSPRDAAIVAWLWTDGTLRMSTRVGLQNKRPKVEGLIYQKKPAQIEVIRRLLVGVSYTESIDPRGKITFRIRARWLRELIDRCRLRDLDPVGFVLSLGSDAMEAFLDACWLAEGWTHGNNGCRMMAQNRGPVLDAMCLATYMCGYKPSTSRNGNDKNVNISMTRPFVHGQWLESEPAGREPVWCVQTGLGSWTMRSGADAPPVLTGNSTSIFSDCNVMIGWHQDAAMARDKKVQGRLIKNRNMDKGPPGKSGYFEFYEYWDRDRMIMEPWTDQHQWMAGMKAASGA